MSKTWLVMDRGEIVTVHTTADDAHEAATRRKRTTQRESDVTVRVRTGVHRWWTRPVAHDGEATS
jgi:hypothetical protein